MENGIYEEYYDEALHDYRPCIGKMEGRFDHVYCIGDIHGRIPSVFDSLKDEAEKEGKEIALILLGDVGANYYGGQRDSYFKEQLNKIGVHMYCLRGNHEKHPKDVPNMRIVFDGYVKNVVYWEEEYPNIKYLIDGADYQFNNITCLALGGAYSVDKWYRLERGWMWFANEQIAEADMEMIEAETAGNFYDVVLSHTCPYSWQPTDLFIDAVDQSTVDNTTEKWLEKMADNIIWGKWCFGHFHQTRDIYEESVRMLADDYLMDLEEWYNI